MPSPQPCVHAVTNALAEPLMMASTSAGGFGDTACISATMPEMCGVDIDVPW